MEKEEFKGELPGATALKIDKKDETQERENPSLRVRASFCGNPARKFKVALRRKTTRD